MAAGVNRAETMRACFLFVSAVRSGTSGALWKLLARAFALFSPLLFAADRDFSPEDSDKVSGSAIIHEINIARQTPKLYAIFLEHTRQNYPGRLCAQEGVRAVDE